MSDGRDDTGTRTLAVVTAGLSVPSSTRLLADRLAAATVAALDRRGADRDRRRSSSCASTPTTSPTTSLTGFAERAAAGGRRRRWPAPTR